MQLKTKYHGELEIKQNDIITFDNGIPGFEDEKQFIIIPYDNKSPFYILQSVEQSELAFVTVDIFTTHPEYSYNLSDNVLNILQIEKPDDVMTLGIVTVKENFSESTVNLYAPVVINVDKKLGKQLVLNEAKYDVRTPLFPKSA